MKDTKTLLKEAREAIKNKNFELCLKLCKSILKIDKSNFMGLIFLGLALQEVGPVEQSEKAFQKATEIECDNILGWQGLISYYEKVGNHDSNLVEAYIKILPLETNEKKVITYCEKLAMLPLFDKTSEIVQVLYNVSLNEKFSTVTVHEVLSNLAVLLGKITKLPDDCLNIYESTLIRLLKNKDTVTVENYSALLMILHKLNKIDELIDNAEKMCTVYERSTTPLLWLCKIFNQSFVEGTSFRETIEPKIAEYYKRLLELEQNNAMALFSKSIILFREEKIIEAKDTLMEVTNSRPGLIHAWVFLTKIYSKLRIYEEALQSICKVDKLLNSSEYSNTILQVIHNEQQLQILPKSLNNKDLLRVEEIYNKMQDKPKYLPHLIESYINLNKFELAQNLLNEVKDEYQKKLLTALLYHKQNKLQEALEILTQNNFDSSEWWMETGLICWELKEYRKCLAPFIKAAKCDPYNYLIFFYLGNYYQKFDDLEKARRCYEKTVKINVAFTEGTVELSRMYRKLKKWDENLQFLESLTTNSINKNNSWAWLQLGLNYLEQEDYDKAIDNLRLVIRVDPNNVLCWESLADAYFERGAYTSALKSYQIALKLSEHSTYSALQVANIKKILGEYLEAKLLFDEILLKNEQYLPALKGLAETSISQAKQCLVEQRPGSARDHLQDALDKIALTVQQRSEFSCLWKILADCCLLAAKLPDKYSGLLASKSLVEGSNSQGNVILEKMDLFSFAIRCYCKSITQLNDNTLLWHDLSSAYYEYALCETDESKAKDLFTYALAAIERCTNVNPENWEHWNLLGNIAMMQSNYALAQHAYIVAVKIDHSSAVAWSNLGVLYFLMNEIKLANLAFGHGQRSDPNYVNSWIGQALIAEVMDHEDAMDLFRHTTQLQPHQQGAAGYGKYVCKTILEAEPDAVIYAIHNMHAVSVACDALTWYTEKDPYDACAWNMLGILQERLGLKRNSLNSFEKAYRLSDKQHKDKTRVNYGRLLLKLNNYPKSIDIFKEVEEATFSSGSGLALALFKDKSYEDSYSAYEQSLNWLTENQNKQSDLLVALASMAYMFQGPDSAKQLLFQSIQLKPPSPWSLYATLSLGLLHDNVKLAKLVLKELENLKDQNECLQHYTQLLSYFYLIKGEYNKAVIEVSKLVHRHPNNPYGWLTLSMLLIRLNGRRKSSLASTKCAEMAMNLGKVNMDVTKVLCLVSLGLFIAGDDKKALISAQKAVHCYPEVTECWAVLSSALIRGQEKSKVLANKILKYLECSPDTSVMLMTWLKNQQNLLIGH